MMTGWMRIAVLALGLGATVQADAACWSQAAVAAAHVRNLQSLLMSSALQCRLIAEKVDVIADYNRFVNGRRGDLEATNRELKTHFTRSAGSNEGGQVEYDRFTTSLANMATRDRAITGRECRKMAALARAAAVASPAMMVDLALSQGSEPELQDGACPAMPAPVRMVEIYAPVGEFGPIERVQTAEAPVAPQGIPQPTYTSVADQPAAGFQRLGTAGPPQP